jgi:MFS family permease
MQTDTPLFSSQRTIQRSVAQLARLTALVVFALVPFWARWSFAPQPFTATYTLGFVITWLMLLTVGLWLLSGLRGWREFIASRRRIIWAGGLMLLVLWATLSQEWAFIQHRYPSVAQNAALQWAIVVGFVLTCAMNPPRLKWVLYVLVGSMLLHGLFGGLQVAQQSSLGLPGEITLDPAQSGVSVIEADGVRWLRPYGFLPHPNIFAGILTAGLLSLAPFLLRDDKWRYTMWGIWAAGLWCLMLTFSRGAWLGFATGLIAGLILIRHATNLWRKLTPVIALSLVLGVGFVMLYQPFLIARTTINNENTEMRSVVDRIVFNHIATLSIASQPLQGVGAGNFPWVASYYIHYETDYDLEGDNVHNIYLTLLSELGLVGFTLFLMSLTAGMLAAVTQIATARSPDNHERAALLAVVIAFMLIGLVDHYPVTLPQTTALWLGSLALSLSPSRA